MDSTNDREQVDKKKYREIVGSLIYLMTCTRSDIGRVVSKLSQRLSRPTLEDLVAAKHVLTYLKRSKEYELCFKKYDAELSLMLVVTRIGHLQWMIGTVRQDTVLV